MTRLLIAYDASAAARAAVAAAARLFPCATAAVASVATPVAAATGEALIRADMPGVTAEQLQALAAEGDDEAATAALEGAALAATAGLSSDVCPTAAGSPWRALLAEARRRDSDVIVCGTRGEGAADRILLGSTASSLLHHTDRPLFVVPARTPAHDYGPLLAGYDGSTGADAALRFASLHLAHRPLVVARAWRSPMRRSARGRALVRVPVTTLHDYAAGVDGTFAELAAAEADAGTRRARDLGLHAEPCAPEARRVWIGLVEAASEAGAAAILVGARGRGAMTSTVLGSVTSALVHAAVLPVLVVPARSDFLTHANAGG